MIKPFGLLVLPIFLIATTSATVPVRSLNRLLITEGPTKTLTLMSRGISGVKLADGRAVVHDGLQTKASSDGRQWINITNNLSTNMSLKVQNQDGDIVSYHIDGNDPVNDVNELVYQEGTGHWQGKYQLASDFGGRVSRIDTFLVRGLPLRDTLKTNSKGVRIFEPYEAFKPAQAFVHNGLIHLAIVARYTLLTNWRGQLVKAHYYDTLLAMADSAENYFDFHYLSTVVDQFAFQKVVASYPIPPFYDRNNRLPVVFAYDPKCIGLPNRRIVCAVRTSGDDQQPEVRPLNASSIFVTTMRTLGVVGNLTYGVIKGNEVKKGTFSPPLEPHIYYQAGFAPLPPLILATSDTNGNSWQHKIINNRGGINCDFAYDVANNLLLIAYAGLTYPYSGVIVQYSIDSGDHWSDPINISDYEGYNDGHIFAGYMGNGTFAVLYSTSPKYVRDREPIENAKDEWTSYYKILEFETSL